MDLFPPPSDKQQLFSLLHWSAHHIVKAVFFFLRPDENGGDPADVRHTCCTDGGLLAFCTGLSWLNTRKAGKCQVVFEKHQKLFSFCRFVLHPLPLIAFTASPWCLSLRDNVSAFSLRGTVWSCVPLHTPAFSLFICLLSLFFSKLLLLSPR